MNRRDRVDRANRGRPRERRPRHEVDEELAFHVEQRVRYYMDPGHARPDPASDPAGPAHRHEVAVRHRSVLEHRERWRPRGKARRRTHGSAI
jgi:hypothetical protein